MSKDEAQILGFKWKDAPRYVTALVAMLLPIPFMYQADSFPHLLAYLFLFVACTSETFLSQILNPLNLTPFMTGFFISVTPRGPYCLWLALPGTLLGFAQLKINMGSRGN